RARMDPGLADSPGDSRRPSAYTSPGRILSPKLTSAQTTASPSIRTGDDGMRRSLVRIACGVTGLILTAFLTTAALRADDWPQGLGPKREGVWREIGLLDAFPKGGPTVKWRKPVGAGYAGPAVANGRVYVTDFVAAKGAKLPKSGFDTSGIP